MASTIETQARQQLIDMEQIVYVVTSLSQLASSNETPDSEAFTHLSVVLDFVTGQLHDQFQKHHDIISKQVLPLVADVKISHLAKS